MKHLYLVIILVFGINTGSNSQIVSIPDTIFLKSLIEQGIDLNNDNSIQVSEAEAALSVDVSDKWIISLEGIASFINLETLNCGGNNRLSELNVSTLTALKHLDCHGNPLSELDISMLNELTSLNCSKNLLTELDISKQRKLKSLYCSQNDFSSLDISQNVLLEQLNVGLADLTVLDLSNTPLLKGLNCQRNSLTSLDLSSVPDLRTLVCSGNELESLDLTNIPLLEKLDCGSNGLTEIDLGHLPLLQRLDCGWNSLRTLDVSFCPLLRTLGCHGNKLTVIDLSGNRFLDTFACQNNSIMSLDFSNNPLLNYMQIFECNVRFLNIKNGNTDPWKGQLFFGNTATLEFLCVDDHDYAWAKRKLEIDDIEHVILNSYCSVNPGGNYNLIQGQTSFDHEENGCDSLDILFPHLKLSVFSNIDTGQTISDASGQYRIPLANGTSDLSVKPILEKAYFSVEPDNFIVSFPPNTSPHQQDFCLTANGVFHDVAVIVVPLNRARPGFDSRYKIKFENKGTTRQSGHIALQFDDAVINYSFASEVPDTTTGNRLVWRYSDLAPFEQREFTLYMDLNSPVDMPPLNNDDIIEYSVTIHSLEADYDSSDNTFNLMQTVVNSFDPNDKKCLGGDLLHPENVGEFVHYQIRFENKGSAEAVNVIVKDVIEAHSFDITSLIVTDASHDMITRISKENQVEFVFEGINLPFEDDKNDGYVTFKIRSLSSLKKGDLLHNTAEIYFDFNAPIITNLSEVKVDFLTGQKEYGLINHEIMCFPNPCSKLISITSAEQPIKHIELVNAGGKVCSRIDFIGGPRSVNIKTDGIPTGVFSVLVTTNEGVFAKQIIKE